eukprot:gnl/TRDRNA2_/TRDRNA2_36778_c0_seq1.p1 gnl/TRDRNA2_/TRDRNA2_36778_c0~~gnl/TRDRNA2_/TRDRNA2_36778_c0_seq1.p1  ORF type:complete len:274 (+),score=81.19 gnl/TRDRNA2_/TRDRNA2_36778_c0_seq1:58-879(+)
MDSFMQREYKIMTAPLVERDKVEDQLLFDHKTYDVDDKGYSWKQTPEELEVMFTSIRLTKEEARTAKVVIGGSHLKVVLKGETVFDDDLWETVRTEESCWTVSDGVLSVNLVKLPLMPPERNNWPRCGKSEPHKYDKAYKAKLARREARQKEKEEEAELADDPDMPDLEDYVPISERGGGDVPTVEDEKPLPTAPTRPLPAEKEDESDDDEEEDVPPASTSTQAWREHLQKEAKAKEAAMWKKKPGQADIWVDQQLQRSRELLKGHGAPGLLP